MRWSISCWMMQALKPEYLCWWIFPFISMYLTSTRFALWTNHFSQGRERQASSDLCTSSEVAMISGLMRSVSHRKSLSAFSPVGIFFRWVVAIMRMVSQICGAASPTPSYAHISSNRISQSSLISGVIFSTSSQTVLSILLSFPVSRG